MKLFSNISLTRKLPVLIAVPAIAVVLGIGVLQMVLSRNIVSELQRSGYRSLVEEQGEALERWLDGIERDVQSLSQSFAVTSAIRDFSYGWVIHGGDTGEDLRRLYISENPNPVGSKDELDDAGDGSVWSAAHARHHPGLRSFQRARGYYDLFLFDMRGNLVYSVFKEDDFALNFEDGIYSDTGLGEVFRAGRELEPDQIHLTEIAPYGPSADAPAMFMSTPVYEDGAAIGVVAVQIPLDMMGMILSDSAVLGETGLVYLIGSSGQALTNSPHDGGFGILDQLPDLAQISAALDGRLEFMDNVTGVEGHSVVALSGSVETTNGAQWGMVFEIDRAEANDSVQQLIALAGTGLVATAVSLAVLSFFAVRGVIRRIERLSDDMDEVAASNFAHEIAGSAQGDEIGAICRTLDNLKGRLEEAAAAQEREKETQVAYARVVELLSDALLNLANGDFRNSVTEFFPYEHRKLRYRINDAMAGLNEAIASVGDTASRIRRGAGDISGGADELSHRTENQAATLEETAAALEELTASVHSAVDHVKNVEDTVTQARSAAQESGEVVRSTIEAMNEIETSSGKIAQIINVIDDIAFQTNLLALNAGVEAARAGDAGRGFAVVASEVRALAQRSSEAALEINTLIDGSGQHVSRGVELVGQTGEALTGIVEQVRHISELVTEISKSSQEQSRTLTEINRAMSQLDTVTQRNAAMVLENTTASHKLSDEADQLSELVARFKIRDEAETAPSAPPGPPAEGSQEAEPKAATG